MASLGDALATGLVLTVLAGLAAARARWKRGKRVLPRIRVKTYFSIRTAESEAPSEPTELDASEIEIIDSSKRVDSERPTPDIRRRRRP